MSKAIILWFLQLSDFITRYFLEHKTGVMGVRLCSLNNLKLNFIHTESQFQMFTNWLHACMVDAPQCGYNICVWTYQNGNVIPHISQCDTSLIPVPADGSKTRPTIHEDIANHVKVMADGNPVVAFEVSFFDMDPAHRWLFVTA